MSISGGPILFYYSIGGYPFITRFKTQLIVFGFIYPLCIGGYPFITRFKTILVVYIVYNVCYIRYWRLSIYNKV